MFDALFVSGGLFFQICLQFSNAIHEGRNVLLRSRVHELQFVVLIREGFRGYNTTFGGQTPGSRHLGSEGLLGTVVRIPVGETQLDGRVEGAVFAPGAAFDGLVLETLATVRAGVDWRW